MDESQHFANLLKLGTPAERAAYLDEVCAGDPELRAELEALLRAHAADPDFLERPAGSVPGTADEPAAGGATGERPPQPAGAEQPGQLLGGRYKLLEQIGEGGMGTVWMARQTEPVKRVVAVKLIKPGMDSAQVLGRLEAERQALALMDHPNIAKVLDAGETDSGRPFFVMELVRGVPITQYCDQRHLTPRQRLELFAPVCHAVQHAHQKGVIHRDLKPSNVLIALYDDKPVPKVIDFGVAKATGSQLTEQTLHTAFGAVVGTVEYMSPEQAGFNQLDVDTRSDIYSLGVLLYELLAGSPPFSRKELKTAGMLEMLRVIREQEPSKPSTRLSTAEGLASLAANRGTEPAKLTRLVRGELDWIVMKALEKDRNRRYDTANAFAMDVQRYLADEAVLACPPSAVYRLRKFAGRSRKLLITAAAFAILLFFAAAVSSWQWWRAEQHARAEQAERERAEKKSLEAAENARQTREAIKKSFTRLSETTLLNQPGLTPLRIQLLQDAREFYESFLQQSCDDPELQVELAASYLRLATINVSLDRNNDAQAAYTKGLELVEKLLRERPGDTEFPKQLAGYFQYRYQLAERTQPPSDPLKSLADLRNATAIWDRFALDNPQESGFRSDLASQYMLLGMLQQELRQFEDALASYQKVRTLSAELIRARPGVDSYQALFLDSSVHAAAVLGDMGRSVERNKVRSQTVESFEKLAADLPTSATAGVHLARAYSEWAKQQGTAGWPEIEKAYRQAIGVLEKLEREASGNANSRLELSAAYDSLAELLGQSGRRQEADDIFAKAVAINEKVVTDFPNSPDHRVSLAQRYLSLGDRLKVAQPREAEQAYRRALAVEEKLAADFPAVGRYWRSDWPKSRELLIGVLRAAGQSGEVEDVYRRTIARLEKLAAAFPDASEYRTELARTHNRLGLHLRKAGRAREAESELEKAKGYWRAGPDPAVNARKKAAEAEPGILDRWHQLGVAYYRAGDWEAVLETFPAKAGGSAWQWFWMAMAHSQLGHKEEAQRWYYRSLDWMATAQEKRLRDVQAEAAGVLGLPDPGDRSRRAWELGEEGTAYERQGEAEKAKASYGKAIDLYAKLAAEFPAVPAYHAKLFDLLAKSGRQEEAQVVLRRAVADCETRAAEMPGDPASRHDVAVNYVRLGDLLANDGKQTEAARRLAEAEQLYRKAIALEDRLAADFPASPEHRMYAATYRVNCLAGLLWRDPRRLPEAEAQFLEALKIWRQLAAEFPADRWYRHELAYDLGNLGWLWLGGAKRPDKAEPYYREANEYHQKLVAEDPTDPGNRERLAWTRSNLAEVLSSTGRKEEAEKARRGVLDVFEQLAADFPAKAEYQGWLAENYDALVRALRGAGRVGDALDVRRRAVKVYERLASARPDDPGPRDRLARSRWHLAWLLREAGQKKEAAEAFREAIAGWEKLAAEFRDKPEYRRHVTFSYGDLAAVLNEAARFGEAENAYSRAVELAPGNAALRANRGFHYARQKQWDKAIADYDKAIELGPKDAGLHNNLAWTLATGADPEGRDLGRAVTWAKKAVELAPGEGIYWNTLGAAHYRAGDWKAALAALGKSMELRKGGDAFDWVFLAMAHWQLGDRERAHQWFALAVWWAEKNQPANDELRRFRAEAGSLPGVSAEPGPGRSQAQHDETEVFTLVLAANPRAAWAYSRRASALAGRNQWNKAAADCAKALELDPKEEHVGGLVRAFARQVRLKEFEPVRAAWQKAVEHNPPDHDAWFGYAELCLYLGREEEYRRHRADLLARFGDTTNPVIAERVSRACLLLPASGDELRSADTLATRAAGAGPNHGLYGYFAAAKGLAEYRLGRFDSAIGWLQKADARRVTMPVTRLVQAIAWQRQGQTRQARAILADALRSWDWSEATADNHDQWIAHVLRREAEAVVVPNLPAFLGGEYQPPDNKERLELIEACRFRKRYRAVARLYADVLAAEPKLADDLKAGHRYAAARAAARAAAGDGHAGEKLDESERARWREQALGWLHADLALWAKQLDGNPTDRAALQETLRRWLSDPDLAGVRGEAIAELPEGERAACHKLWADVETLLRKTRGG